MASVSVEDVALAYPIIGGPKTVKHEVRAGDGMGNLTTRNNRFHGVHALRGVSFDLQRGDRLGIVGRNGSGKSTLLRVLAGIYPPTRGHVDVVGQITTLFQMGIGMRPAASGYRNIILQSMISGRSRKEAEAMVNEVEKFTELGEFLHLPMSSYSQGMAMRLNFAIATAVCPDILIMDEWVGAGDAEFQTKAKSRIDEMTLNAGIIIIATHNKQLLKQVCNKALWLHMGVQRAFGNVDDVVALHEASAA